MAATSANTVTTLKARQKFAQAHGSGDPVPKIEKIGWGTGGHDQSTGQPIFPDDGATVVPGEFIRKNIAQQSYPNSVTVRVLGVLESAEGLNKSVSACGLYDAAGDLIALKTFTPKGVDEDTRLEIEWDEEF